MKHTGKRVEASRTAQWVAAARTLGGMMPPELVIARDPFGASFAEGAVRKLADGLLAQPLLARLVLPHAGPLTGFLLWMQLRTRALDDILLEFVRRGGRQVVLLGAGYDCRALRFAGELVGVTVFEVDQLATQARKAKALPAEGFHNRVVYLPFDFERDPLTDLPARLHAQGLDPQQPVLTLWEGVTMYLTESAVEATLAAVHAFAAQSQLALTYIDRRALKKPPRELAWSARIAAHAGEPWRFGWEPSQFAGWMASRGFTLIENESDGDLAARLLPAHVGRYFAKRNRRLALVRSYAR